jgi:hypothetical protein
MDLTMEVNLLGDLFENIILHMLCYDKYKQLK